MPLAMDAHSHVIAFIFGMQELLQIARFKKSKIGSQVVILYNEM